MAKNQAERKKVKRQKSKVLETPKQSDQHNILKSVHQWRKKPSEAQKSQKSKVKSSGNPKRSELPLYNLETTNVFDRLRLTVYIQLYLYYLS